MNPKFIRDNYDLIIENEKKRSINGNGIDNINIVLDLYSELNRINLILQRFQHVKNNSEFLIKNSKTDKIQNQVLDDNFWDNLKMSLYDTENKSTQYIEPLKTLNYPNILIILKNIKNTIKPLKKQVINIETSIETHLETLGNLVPNRIHNFVPKKDFQTSEENPYIFAPGSPIYGSSSVEPNVKFNTILVDYDDYSRKVLYISETPSNLFTLEQEDQNVSLKSHYQLTCDLKLVMYNQPSKMNTNHGYSFVSYGVKLNRALTNYALDFIDQKGYKMIQPPHTLKYSCLKKVTFPSMIEKSLYQTGKQNTKNPSENTFLTDVPQHFITSLYIDKLLKSTELPIRHVGFSECYSKDKMSHGANAQGIFDVHQFEVIEQFVVCNPENSWDEMSRMIKITAEFYNALGIKYRIVNVPPQNIDSFTAIRYDFEGYFPHLKKYCKIGSCSNYTDFLPKKVRCRIENYHHKNPHFIHATLCINTKTLCCILETYQTQNNSLDIPSVLVPYMNGISKLTIDLV